MNRPTDECLPIQTRKIRSTDDPWITDEIKRVIRKRKRRHKKGHRNNRWREAKEESDHLIKREKKIYYDKAIAKLGKDGGQIPYRILKDIAIPDRPKPWSINSLQPGIPDAALADELAGLFMKITDEFTPISGGHPITFPSPFKPLLPHEIAKRIKDSKKSKSAISGDVLPVLASSLSDFTAVPVTRIVNFALH